MTQLPRALAFALLLPLTACATKRDLRDLQSEIRALSQRQDSAFVAIRQMDRTLQDSVTVSSEALFQFRGDMNNQLLNIQDQLIRLGELTGQSQRSLAGLRDQLDAQRQQGARSTSPPPNAGNEAEGVDLIPGTGAPRDVYNVAVTQLNRGNFSVATMTFRRFLQEYPDHELAPSAHIRLGELLAQEKRFEEAAVEYLKVRELFPTAVEVPDALFRAGSVYLEMEDFGLARQYLEQVVNSYPEHPLASLAQERLEDIP